MILFQKWKKIKNSQKIGKKIIMDKKGIVGVCILLAVMLGLEQLSKKMAPEPVQKEEKTFLSDASSQAQEFDENLSEDSNENFSESKGNKITSENKSETILTKSRGIIATEPEQIQSAPVKTSPIIEENVLKLDNIVFSKSDSLKLYIDPNTATILQAELGDYLSKDRKRNVKLGSEAYPMLNLEPIDEQWNFSSPKIVTHTEEELIIERVLRNKNVLVQHHWKFDKEIKFRYSYNLTFKNLAEETTAFEGFYMNCGSMKPLEEAINIKFTRLGQTVELRYASSDDQDSFNVKEIGKMDRNEKINRRSDETIDWLAVKNKYFCSIVSGTAPFKGYRLDSKAEKVNETDVDLIMADVIFKHFKLERNESRTYSFDCFLGAQEYYLLSKLGKNKESLLGMDLFMFWHPGWMATLTKFILKSMIGINNAINHKYGYALAIILITIVIKMLFWPITHKSTVSMRKMQDVQPKIAKIREEYKGNQQEMQRKIMELYKEEKVNPFGGCLPMLIQIPVFFSLFNTFRSAVELRQAEFLWIDDLSLPDTVFPGIGFPLRPLAIIMGVSMMVQQKLTPSTGDASQKKMMYFMSIFFVFMLYGMPAGLTLYWTVNQLISIGQYYFSHKHIEKKKAVEA